MSTFTYDHIHIRSRDPEKTAAYYERMFDAEIIRSVQEGQPRIDMKIGGQDVFIAPVPEKSNVNPPPVTPYQGLDHFGLRVKGIDQGRRGPEGQGRRVHHGAELAAAGHQDLLHPRAGRRVDRSAGARGEMMRLLALALLLALDRAGGRRVSGPAGAADHSVPAGRQQ